MLEDDVNDFGYLYAFEKNDFRLLNNVIFQGGRYALLNSASLESGSGQCYLLYKVLTAFACNDFEVTEPIFPKEQPEFKSPFFTQISVDLIKMMYYKQPKLAPSIIANANKFLEKKRVALDKFVLVYLLALWNRDVDKATYSLQELCKAYQRQGPPVDKLDKCFAAEIHGLYRFARLIDEDFFSQITRPNHPCFFEEFELWQQENNYPKGAAFYTFPAEMNYMNKILQAEIPKITLEDYKYGKVIKNSKKILIDLTENINKIIE